ncbi:hypothetical protein DFH11DRAFT_1516581, partial [Phellopilus nigrolimitatus]
RVGRVKVIFSLPKVFTDAAPHAPEEHLAFVEWFTRPRAEPDTASKLYEVRKQKEIGTGELTGQIISLTEIRHSVQLVPNFGHSRANQSWKPSNVLDDCESFYINNMGSLHTYQSVY